MKIKILYPLILSLLLSAFTVIPDKMKDEEMIILIKDFDAEQVYIEYGKESGKYTNKSRVYNKNEDKKMRVRLDKVVEGEKYYYRVITKKDGKYNYGLENEFIASGRKIRKSKEKREITIKPAESIYKIPLLENPTKDSISISVFFDKKTEYYYQYGLNKDSLEIKTKKIVLEKDEKGYTKLKKLNKNSKYYYKIYYRSFGETEFSTSKTYSFNTAKDGEFSFVIEADPHFDENSSGLVYKKTLETILKTNPDFIVDLGDVSMVEKFTKMSNEELYYRNMLVRSYWDDIGHSVPFLMVMGNHDGESFWNRHKEEAKKYRNLLLPSIKLDSFYKGLDDTIYSFNWGEALFIILNPFNSSEHKPKNNWDRSLGEEQYKFLEETLENDDSKFKFVFIHNLVGGTNSSQRGGALAAQLYEWGGYNSSGEYEFNQERENLPMPIHQLLKKNKVDIVFHGHDHFYAKEDYDGVIYQLVPQSTLERKQNLQETTKEYGYIEGEFLASRGFLKIEVKGNQADIIYISGDGEEITRYSIDM